MVKTKPRVKLIGKDGNAFAILGSCSLTARRAGWNKEKIDNFMQEAMNGDYDHLLRVCMAHFDVA